ncbi:MAG TPA: class I SAM-dependent methyltransferase [Propionibacteriaceae bacterium]|nr:class I SAM-dependent methyltransferase [Propionibacteriaceae bacterium]
MDVFATNREAWDRAATSGSNPYAQAVSAEQVRAARAGDWQIRLSDQKPVPGDWLASVAGADVLCLASGGGQQAPILAAAGARVTLLDASPGQLALDRMVAERDDLDLVIVEGDMADLSRFGDSTFDLIINPVSTLFAPDLEPIWAGCARTLRRGGELMTGFLNPDEFVFDADALDERGEFVVRHRLPYREHETLTADQIENRRAAGEMFHFSHTMETQLGGILAAGLVITGFYEDRRPDWDGNRIRHYLPSYFVVRARRL